MSETDLTADELALLKWLAPSDMPVPRSRMPLADRKADKVRQSCKRRGYIEFVGGIMGGAYRPMGWRLTAAGRSALARAPYQLPHPFLQRRIRDERQ
jgi:hypothetical protein